VLCFALPTGIAQPVLAGLQPAATSTSNRVPASAITGIWSEPAVRTVGDAAAPTPSTAPGEGPSPTPQPHSSLTTLRLPSRDRGRSSRDVVVYRPAVPDTRTLPVLYLLHGTNGTPSALLNSGLQQTLDRLFASGISPFVVAAAEGGSTVRSDDEWGDATDGADRLEAFLQHDVVPAVEGSLPRDRAHRAVAGFSMGGYAAAFTAGIHHDLYGQTVSLAGYFHVDDPEHVFTNAKVRDLHYPLHHLRWLTKSRVLLLDCTQEDDPVIAGEARRMHDALARIGHAPGLHFTRGQHDGAWISRQWPLVARFLAEGWGR
jgi:enterochelin esterase-like enzyme